MIIVKLMGGMGNQMFQYAFGRYLSHKHRTELKLDLSFLQERPKTGNRVIRNYDLDIFKIRENFATPAEVRRFTRPTGNRYLDKAINKAWGQKRGYLIERDMHFSPKMFEAPDDVYLEGYWQSEKYFEPIKDIIREEFTVKEPLGPEAEKMLCRIRDGNSVCVNIRRGDFVTNPTHSVCGLGYYTAAEKLLLEKQDNLRFFVFSDEIDWCRDHLKFSVPATFVTHIYAGKKFQDYFRLMSQCDHFIIPNSSFAWWATYLNKKEGKVVIAPKRWLNLPGFTTDDILPLHWNRIDY
jgi:hypothetical protein